MRGVLRLRVSAVLVPLVIASATRQIAAQSRPASPAQLGTAEMPAFVDWFEHTLRERWSYFTVSGADFDAAFARLREDARNGVDVDDLLVHLQETLALAPDGHAAVLLRPSRPELFLPLLIEAHGERLLAIHADRRSFVDGEHPYLARIDGRDVTEWCSRASRLVARGTPQFVRRQCLRSLTGLQSLRRALGFEERAWADLELISADGRNTRAMSVRLTSARPRSEAWPATQSRVLDGNIGYLRLAQMSSEGVREIGAWMPRFKATSGLIIDVRGNGGGRRETLRLMAQYLLSPVDGPRVGACAAYRLQKDYDPEMMRTRFLFPEDHADWTDAERAAIRSFKSTFRPQWQLPEGLFSQWHYMVLSPARDPGAGHYAGPVLILMDGNCFSATDVFLAAFKGWSNVTLIGESSSGGSGASMPFYFNERRAGVRISTMASFQPDGRLFDGNGIQPDVVVEPAAEFFIGGRDDVLEAAVRRIQSFAASRPATN